VKTKAVAPVAGAVPAALPVVDVRDVACPLTWVRTRIALERLAVGQEVEVLLRAGEALENVPRTAEEEGHRVVAREPWPDEAAGTWRVVLRKGAPPKGNDLLP
jgi:TusA-related sulfurtransferase